VNNFKTITEKFWNQLRNGDDFSLNLGDFTTNLTANVGDKIKVEEVIEVATIVNEGGGTEQEFILTDKDYATAIPATWHT